MKEVISTTIDRPRQLEAAFVAFNELSSGLERSYRDLERRVASLDAQLQGAREARRRQYVEKERLADRLTSLLAELPAGVVVLDGAGRVQEFNRGAVELLGATLVQGVDWQRLNATCVKCWPEAGEAVLRTGRRATVARRALRNERGWIVVLTDVTEVRELHEGLARQQRLSEMGEMAARLAHQIRTPLAAGLLYGSQIESGARSAADQRRLAARIVDRLQHIERMVNDMLAFARGASAEPSAEFALDGLLLDTLRAAEPLCGTHVRLTHEGGPTGAMICGDREALLGVLLNLVNNAVEAAGPQARVGLTAAVEDGVAELRVTDNGPGISETLVDRVFEPFFTTRSGGTGLGLAVVRSVIDAHRGTITVGRVASGGCEFAIRLPVRSVLDESPRIASKKPVAVSSGPAPGSSSRVLGAGPT